jgi:hypothetical protein
MGNTYRAGLWVSCFHYRPGLCQCRFRIDFSLYRAVNRQIFFYCRPNSSFTAVPGRQHNCLPTALLQRRATTQVANRDVTRLRVGDIRSRGYFATPVDFPPHDGSPYRGLRVTTLGFEIRPSFCRPGAQPLEVTISQLVASVCTNLLARTALVLDHAHSRAAGLLLGREARREAPAAAPAGWQRRRGVARACDEREKPTTGRC